jgi:flagellar protein FliL
VATDETKLPDGLAEAGAASATGAAEPAGETADVPGGASRKKRLVLIGAAALLAVGGGGGAWFWLAGGETAEEAHAEADMPESFVDVPPMTVNLRTADGASRYLKVHLMLVPGKIEGDAITKRLPLVIDSYQPFLRELRPEDLAGSAATFRIKEELLVRANAMLGRGAVRDVLIQDLVQQ